MPGDVTSRGRRLFSTRISSLRDLLVSTHADSSHQVPSPISVIGGASLSSSSSSSNASSLPRQRKGDRPEIVSRRSLQKQGVRGKESNERQAEGNNWDGILQLFRYQGGSGDRLTRGEQEWSPLAQALHSALRHVSEKWEDDLHSQRLRAILLLHLGMETGESLLLLRASSAAKALARVDPSSSSHQFLLGVSFLLLGRPRKALPSFQEASQQDPDNAECSVWESLTCAWEAVSLGSGEQGLHHCNMGLSRMQDWEDVSRKPLLHAALFPLAMALHRLRARAHALSRNGEERNDDATTHVLLAPSASVRGRLVSGGRDVLLRELQLLFQNQEKDTPPVLLQAQVWSVWCQDMSAPCQLSPSRATAPMAHAPSTPSSPCNDTTQAECVRQLRGKDQPLALHLPALEGRRLGLHQRTTHAPHPPPSNAGTGLPRRDTPGEQAQLRHAGERNTPASERTEMEQGRGGRGGLCVLERDGLSPGSSPMWCAVPASLLQPSMEFSYSELKVATSGFSASQRLGLGSSGAVYRGILRGTDVAVKRLHHTCPSLSGLSTELQVLSRVRHPHIVTLMGHCPDPEHPCLVYELLSGGDLHKNLKKVGSEALSVVDRLRIAKEMASALVFMNQCRPQVVHLDLKPRNILLDEHRTAKIADWGLARDVPHSLQRQEVVGTMGYIAPELELDRELSKSADVFSFGVILLQLLTGLLKAVEVHGLVERLTQQGRYADVADAAEALVPHLDPGAGDWPKELALPALSVALRCMHKDRGMRPGLAEEVHPELMSVWEDARGRMRLKALASAASGGPMRDLLQERGTSGILFGARLATLTLEDNENNKGGQHLDCGGHVKGAVSWERPCLHGMEGEPARRKAGHEAHVALESPNSQAFSLLQGRDSGRCSTDTSASQGSASSGESEYLYPDLLTARPAEVDSLVRFMAPPSPLARAVPQPDQHGSFPRKVGTPGGGGAASKSTGGRCGEACPERDCQPVSADKMDEALVHLMGMGLTPADLADAAQVMLDERRARLFCTLPHKARALWLKKQIGQQSVE